jgi:peptide deformylase
LAVRPILELPNPVLRERAKKVRQVDASILQLAYDMIDTMRDANGVGLAANQVGELKRVIVIQLPEEEEARIYINPEIVQREGERKIEEGCLSIPGYKGFIKRSVWVKFRALDHSAKLVKLKADDLLAQALEHEVDHLNGILYIDHLEDHEKLIKVETTAEVEDTGNNEDKGQSESGENSNGLWVPNSEPDPRETPASLKIK